MPVEVSPDMAREDGGLRFGVALTRGRAASTGRYTGECDRTHGCRPVPQNSDRAAGDLGNFGCRF
jgi:hypothetical protein